MSGVSIEKVRLVGAIGGHIIIEWVLTTSPGTEWIDAFDSARPKRRGTPIFLLGGSGSPKVREGGTIRWSVPHSDIGAAASFVLESLVYANSRLEAEAGGPTGDQEAFAQCSRPPNRRHDIA